MKERVDSKVVREPGSQEAEVKIELKEEGSSDSRPPSNKMTNGDTETAYSVKSEDNNNKRVKLEKKDTCKTENGKPGSVGMLDSQKSSPQQAGTPQHPSSGPSTPALQQPQNIMVTSSDPPFTQQQSQIFVFSTDLANQAADSVRHGHFKTIIQFHIEHPNTKVFLQKHPLKPGNNKMGIKGSQAAPSGMMRMAGHSPGNWPPIEESMMGPGGMMQNGPRMMGPWPGPGCGAPQPGFPGPDVMMAMESEMMGGARSMPSTHIPDENLTPEQMQHRSKGLARLTKIRQMLMGGGVPPDKGGIGPDGRPMGPGMYSNSGMIPPQQQAIMSQQQAMMAQSGMMPPHGMMPGPQQHMMQPGMSPYGPRGPSPVPHGMNGKDQFQAQRDWYRVQQEFFVEKQHRMQIGSRPPHMDAGPPPSYYSSISQKHTGMGPPSPGMNGMRMPMGPHGPTHMPMEPDGMNMGIYGGPPELCRPGPPMGMEPGMHGFPGMPQQGPMDPSFDPTLAGSLPPGISPTGGPRHPASMQNPHMLGPNGMMGPSSKKSSAQVTLHRAGNPEQFNPETMGGVIPPITGSSNSASNNSKPPPSYAQAQKRKRDDMDDSYTKGNLQQTPSPTKIQYHLNQFEGQELTITKQLNAAFVPGNGGDDGSGGPFNSHTNSPLHGGPPSNKPGGPLSNSSQVSAHMASPPVVPTAGPSPLMTGQPGTPHSLPTSTVVPHTPASNPNPNLRLSHFDPNTALNNGIGNSPIPSTSKPSMSNITSATLANLAKGVENLSNNLQQNMMQGGPFHSIQVQGQMTSNGSNSNNANTSCVTSSAPSGPLPSQPSSSQSPSTPTINNSYIPSNLSISQPNHPSMNNYVNMQMQNVSSESTPMSMVPGQMPAGPHVVPGGPSMMPNGAPNPTMMGVGPRMPHHMIPSSGMVHPGPPVPQGANPSSMPHSPALAKGQFTSPPLSHPSSQPPGITSPPFPVTPSSNSSVQIQTKGHNTIQYLPANPPSSQIPSSMKPRPDIEFPVMQRFNSPISSMDGKNPPSNMQYFPPSPGGSRPPGSLSAAAGLGPEFANQAAIAMQSAAMMQSPDVPNSIPVSSIPSSVGPMENPIAMGGPSHMGGPDPIMNMRPGHSPASMRSMLPNIPPTGLECVSPIPPMGGYMGSGPSIEQAQAQAQAHAAMMMQGSSQLPGSSPHGGPSPHIPPGAPMHGPSIPPGSSPLPVQSPHGPMPSQIPGPSSHGPMGGATHPNLGGPSPHGPMHGGMPLPGHHLPQHGHMGPGMPRYIGPRMGPGSNPYGHMQYSQYPHQEFYPAQNSRGHRQMMPAMMGGPPVQPYGMMPNMPGPT